MEAGDETYFKVLLYVFNGLMAGIDAGFLLIVSIIYGISHDNH
jgi:hypothetical protein